MKKQILYPALLSLLFLGACGPAAESREHMHARAKAIADSMANLIKTAMAEAEMPATPAQVVVPDTNANKTNTTVLPPK